MLIEGIFIPLTTPFYPDGRVYLRKLEHNVGRYSLTPAAGMLVPDGRGEAAGLSDAELVEVLETAIAAAAPEKVMVATITRESVSATLKLAERAAALGYDAVAIGGPEFVADSALQVETLTYFEAVADRSPLPVIVLSQGVRVLSLAMLVRLANHPHVIGAVDDEADGERVRAILEATAGITREVLVTPVFAAATARMLRPQAAAGGNFVSAESLGAGATVLASAPPVAAIRTRTKRVGFQVLAGRAAGILEAWKAGAVGAVPRLAACAPQGCCEVWQAFRDQDLALAEEKLARILPASQRVEGPRGVAAAKHGCDLNGYYGGRPRLPLLGLTEAEKVAFQQELQTLRN